MDHLILGLLMFQNLTIYEIRNKIREGIYLMYSDSMGSIQAALKKLTLTKSINFEQVKENGKQKKIYSITEIGKHSFYEWLSTPMNAEKMVNQELGKLFFMGMLKGNQQESLIQTYIDNLEKKRNLILEIQELSLKKEFDSSLKEIAKYQFYTIQLAIDSISFEIDWYKILKSKISIGGLL